MKKFTVISFCEESGQTMSDYVVAKDIENAFASASALRDYGFEMVVALSGWQSESKVLAFPGEGVVDSDTILEQTDVFGKPVYQVTQKEILVVLEQHKERLVTVPECLSALAGNLVDELNTFQIMRTLFEHKPSSQKAARQIGRQILTEALVEEGVIKP